MQRFFVRLRRTWWLLLLVIMFVMPAGVQAQSKSLYWERGRR